MGDKAAFVRPRSPQLQFSSCFVFYPTEMEYIQKLPKIRIFIHHSLFTWARLTELQALNG
jgi:hypothetical protein